MDGQDKNKKQAQGEAVQQELERQLRDLGVTVGDAFRSGFAGREEELKDRAAGVGRAVADTMNYVASEIDGAFRDAAGKTRAKREKQPYDYAAGAPRLHIHYRWPDTAETVRAEDGAVPGEAARRSARKRFGAGIALVVCGGLMAFGFLIAALSCLLSTGLYLEGTTEHAVLTIVGISMLAAGAGSLVAAAFGGEQLEASKLLRRCADVFDSLDVSRGIALDDLAALLQKKKRKLRKALRGLINKGWLTGWFDEREDRLYLRAADYRAARDIPPAAPKKPDPLQQPDKPDKPMNLETARRFARVLEKERALMADPAAADELDKMRMTTESICTWLDSHPESAPRARRFAEYYIPTTLKLLHTYNDVQGQKGENAETIRRDIGGILHTLNTAYENLYDTLLSDAALDVSSEIAALEGMLASDGLTGEGLL